MNVAFDSQGNKWISTMDGLLKFDDSTWTRFTPENSGLPDRLVFHVAVDHYDNVWAATYEGLAVYHKGGVVFSRPSGDIPEMKALTDFIFPNPANGMVEIHYEALQAGIVKFELYTISGKFISSVMTTVAQPGNYTQTMDLSGLPSGTYLIKVKIGNRTEAKKVVLSKWKMFRNTFCNDGEIGFEQLS